MSESEVEELLGAFDKHIEQIRLFRAQLVTALGTSSALEAHIHSIRSRIKDREHLKEKLLRKKSKCKAEGLPFDVTPENMLETINDLAGVRILHLHTRQIRDIDHVLREIFAEQQYELREGPFARTWVDKSREFFAACGINTQDSPTMYTSVHYVIGSASRTTVTCEIQVRTLMEEVWGEVDHEINYPAPTQILPVESKSRSSLVRLRLRRGSVDSIFLTHEQNEPVSAPESEQEEWLATSAGVRLD